MGADSDIIIIVDHLENPFNNNINHLENPFNNNINQK